jgi:hypothetical protein
MISSLKDKIVDNMRGLEAKQDLYVLDKLVSKNETPMKSRVLPAAVSSLSALAAGAAISKYITKLPKTAIAGGVLASGVLGYLSPEIHSAVLRYKNQEIPREAAEKILKNINSTSAHAFKKTTETIDDISKNASLTGVAGKMIARGAIKAGKAIVGGSKTTGRALLSGLKKTPAGAPVGERIFGFATKGLAIGAGTTAAASIAKEVVAPESKSNYTTFLRNNILAGNIHPKEVPLSDAKKVNELGMR